LKAFEVLYRHFGRQNWWPAETPFEVIVGAILTQQTTWKNVEKVISRLKGLGVLNPLALYNLSVDELAQLIKESGFYRLKAKRLKNFLEYLKQYNFDLEQLKKKSLQELREELLNIDGIGKETADSILLYALDKPIFVVDNYTKRFGYRFGILKKDLEYDDIRNIFEETLKGKAINETIDNFKEMHALIVELGKNFCKKKPDCSSCSLINDCERKGLENEYS
jgi:endonuclease-3 related protein